MNPAPADTDVLVVGAGPAGSACAQTLAQAGLRVLLADQHAFPRDKVCGDGLIPDAHAAFARLGVAEQISARSQPVSHVRCVAPGGGEAQVPGRLAVLPRLVLDDILRQAAVKAGAQWMSSARFEAPLLDALDRVVGARMMLADGPREIKARWVVLATGATPQALIAAGLCERRTPSCMALRGYVKNPAMAARLSTMDAVWHRKMGRGYGWIFPCGDGVFNIGVGLTQSHTQSADGRGKMADVNLRDMFDAFCKVYPPARELMAGGELLGALKGAPLRCSLEGARLSRPGLLVTGEAAGSTYAFTGEGIGKAMETGLLAAEAIIAAGQDTPSKDAATCVGYEQAVLALKPRFDLYERANRLNELPWLIDLLLWRARHSQRILQRMSLVLEERGNPGNLVSLRGVMKLFVPLR